MRNRAKCKLCADVIESFHADDYVPCKCGEISVDGGMALLCKANNWGNFLRVDDDGKEISVKVVDNSQSAPFVESKPSRADMIMMLDEMVKSYENLPQAAMSQSVTHYDILSILLLVSALFKADA